ncbi:LysR family transcriptional regulator, partial [Escherichia coli]|nr:LysR family transcriptional regulator [Escherichia coli]
MSHLSHLRTFLEAYRSGSFSKAAELLGITQPAASQH